MTEPALYAAAINRGPSSLADVSLVGIILDTGYEFDPDHDTFAALASAEVSGGGYARPAATARIERIDGSWFLFIDDMDDVDLSAVDDRGGIAWGIGSPGDDDADVLTVGWAPDPGGPVNPYHPTWDSGFVEWPIIPVGDRLVALEGRTVAGVASVAGDVPAEALADALEPLLGGGGGGAGSDADLDVTAVAGAAKSASTVDTYTFIANFMGVSAEIQAGAASFLPAFIVNLAGVTQDELNDNLANLAMFALADADLARTLIAAEAERIEKLIGAVAFGAGQAQHFTSPDPYLLVGAGSTPAGYQANCYRMPAVAATFDDGVDFVGDAVVIDHAGIDGFCEVGTHGRLDIDLDRHEPGFRIEDGLVSLFAEYTRVGDPEVAGGEYAPGRIYGRLASPPLVFRFGDRIKFRHTVQNDDGSGHGVVRMWLPTKGVPDETAHGEAWRIAHEIVLDEPTSVSVVDDYWYTGFGMGRFGVFSAEWWEYGGAFSHGFRADQVQLDGTLIDDNGNVATPLGDASVVTP